MLLGKFTITDHAIKQYGYRVNHRDVIKSIKTDLSTLNIRDIVRVEKNYEKYIHIFTKNSKEFIFVTKQDRLYLKTVIKRSSEDNKKTIQKRKGLTTCST